MVATILSAWFASGQSEKPVFGPPMPWVNMVAPPAQLPVSEADSGGQAFALIDTQINGASAETYVHIVKDITSSAGVQNAANLSFSWDPSFQGMTVHQIFIQRGDKRLDRLDPTRFKVIQQETDLDRQVYNGELSALLFLDDVRVGDRIEFSYTVRGENPSLTGHFADALTLASVVPIQSRKIRLVWPQERRLNYRIHGKMSGITPQISTVAETTEYVWSLHDVPAIALEDDTPSWYPAIPWLQVSDYADWKEVAAWADGLFVTSNLDNAIIREKVGELRQSADSAEKIIQNTLEFVQNDIRYLGIEFGPNSYHPTDPLTVLQRRFGDCKDKAFLFCTLLRGLGYHATPVLVGTGVRQTLPDFLPAPEDFDHVISRVEVNDTVYWLDPTRTYQRSSLANRYLPEYSFGLEVDAKATGLSAIPARKDRISETMTAEDFKVGEQKAPTRLTVTTFYNGFDAEWMRAVLASTGRDELAKDYLNDYAQRYPGIRRIGKMQVTDSSDRDSLTFTHAYWITNFWTLAQDKEQYRCEFYATAIHSWITKPATALRSMPLELSFPRRRILQTSIELPTVFTLTAAESTINGPGARLHVQRKISGRNVWMNYEYTALTNVVPVSQVPEHLETLDRMEGTLDYALKWQKVDDLPGLDRFNWPMFILAVLYAAFCVVTASTLCYLHHRWARSTAAPPPIPDASLNGLGGWLILVICALMLSVLRLTRSIITTSRAMTSTRWHALTSPGAVAYQPAWGPLLTMELLCQITVLTLLGIVLVLLFQKRRIFPKWFIGLLVFNALFVVADTVGLQFLKIEPSPNIAANVVQVLIGCCIWIPYACVSRRVKTTFVR